MAPAGSEGVKGDRLSPKLIVKLITMTTEWKWTSDQQQALVSLRELISGSESKAHTLTGMAGSGKTTLTKEFVKMARQSGKQVLAVAPTHKARRVMHQIIKCTNLQHLRPSK